MRMGKDFLQDKTINLNWQHPLVKNSASTGWLVTKTIGFIIVNSNANGAMLCFIVSHNCVCCLEWQGHVFVEKSIKQIV